jgi:YD repeat-containing protein
MLQRAVAFFFLAQCCLLMAQVGESVNSPALPQQQPVLAGDPFDARTGIYYREYHDLFVRDTIPIDFVRTQRNLDSRSRAFGVGSSTSYDMFIIGDVQKFSWVALVLADGDQARFSRISPGVSYSNGVFEDKSDPSEFLGAVISWNGHGGWKVKLRDGREFTVQGCNASSKPGQCAVTEIKRGEGDRLIIQRDRDGNIVKITSPHGHFIDVKTDGAGRIVHAQDDASNWVDYQYDERGRLIRSNNWRHDTQVFQYDERSNMISVRESGPSGRDGGGPYKFEIKNHYDKNDRFSGQWVSNGDWSSANYQTNMQGGVLQTDVSNQSGSTRYFFDKVGFKYREEFRINKRLRWTLEVRREPNTHEVLEATLSCGTGKIDIPVSMAMHLAQLGDAHEAYLTRMCKRNPN